MLGSPLLRACVALGVLLLLLLPLRSFTAARARPAAAALPSAPPRAAAHLEIVSTKVPFAYSVSHLGKVVWQGNSAAPSAATDVRLPIPKEGIDLAASVTWQGEGTAAAKLILTQGDGDPVERTIWGNGSASDVLTFP